MHPTREDNAWGNSSRWHDSPADRSIAGLDSFEFFKFFTFKLT